MGEIDAGDEVVLADGSRAVVECVLRAPAWMLAGAGDGSGVVTTYNLDVGDGNTYFVGAGGMWVHNQGTHICALLSSAGTDAVAAARKAGHRDYVRTLIETHGGDGGLLSQRSKDQLQLLFLELQNQMMLDCIDVDRNVDLTKVRGYHQVKDEYDALIALGRGEVSKRFNSHHGTHRAFFIKIMELNDPNYNPSIRPNDSNLDGAQYDTRMDRFEDVMPSFELPPDLHVEFHKRFLKAMDGEGIEVNPRSWQTLQENGTHIDRVSRYRAALRKVHREMNEVYNTEGTLEFLGINLESMGEIVEASVNHHFPI